MGSVAAELGFKVSRNMAKCCFDDHNDTRASFSIRPRTNTFCCYSCGRKGDTITLVMEKLHTDFVGACRWLEERFGARATQRYSPSFPSPAAVRASIAKFPGREPEQSEVHPDPEVFSWLVERSPLLPSGRSYLTGRGFTERTLDYFKIGQVGQTKYLLRHALEAFGSDRLTRCGLLVDGRFGPYLVFPSGYLLFPFYREGTLVFIQARRADDLPDRRWLCPRILRPPVFNVDVLSQQHSTIFICEGATDVLSAYELDRPAIGLVGANASIDADTVSRLRGHNVAVLGDADRAGTALGARLVARLGEQGISAIAKAVPKGCNDLNDYLRGMRVAAS